MRMRGEWREMKGGDWKVNEFREKTVSGVRGGGK